MERGGVLCSEGQAMSLVDPQTSAPPGVPRPTVRVPKQKEATWKNLTSKRLFFLPFCHPVPFPAPQLCVFCSWRFEGVTKFRGHAGCTVLKSLLESVGVPGGAVVSSHLGILG